MAIAVALDQISAPEVPATEMRRAKAGLACIAQNPTSCEGCRVRPHSLCAALSEADDHVVHSFKLADRYFPAGFDFIEQWEADDEFFVITDGWAVQYELLEDGNRQILDFLLPGSVVGFQADTDSHSPYSVQALTPVTACSFSKEGFFEAAKLNSGLAIKLATITTKAQCRALHRLTLIGRRPAKERVAALLFELYCGVRMLSPVARGDAISLPLTQEHIGDALGLTNVHVNRMLRELREEGVLVLKSGVLRVLDPDRLIEIAGREADDVMAH